MPCGGGGGGFNIYYPLASWNCEKVCTSIGLQFSLFVGNLGQGIYDRYLIYKETGIMKKEEIS